MLAVIEVLRVFMEAVTDSLLVRAKEVEKEQKIPPIRRIEMFF